MKDQAISREALFNEVKGSLFEFLVGKSLASAQGLELDFVRSLDQNYLNVLTQQDRMVRQFYPELQSFLQQVSQASVKHIQAKMGPLIKAPVLLGKFAGNSHEGDLLLSTATKVHPLSLKLNKKNAFVNTKSGGIKSFFTQYFPFLSLQYQQDFNQLVDMEFERMANDLHALRDLPYRGNFQSWVVVGHPELPGELSPEERSVLKAYYARIAKSMHHILIEAFKQDPEQFINSLPSLMGFSSPDIVQLICFHDFKTQANPVVEMHSFKELECSLPKAKILPFHDIASVEIDIGLWSLQIRVKPMNKFTTTAIKVNCSVKIKSEN